jgi:hypothetical protein
MPAGLLWVPLSVELTNRSGAGCPMSLRLKLPSRDLASATRGGQHIAIGAPCDARDSLS